MSKNLSKHGEHTYGEIRNSTNADIVVGKYCSIAANVQAVILADHQTEWITTYPFRKTWNLMTADNPVRRQNRHIVIGNDVWIGSNSILLEETNIADGAVIGSYSVVHGYIPPYTIAVGNPCRPVKKRFSDKEVDQMLKIQWWNWPDGKVKEFAPLLCSPNIKEFLDAVNATGISD